MSTPPEDREGRRGPSFTELLLGNARVLAWVAVVVLAAWAVWRGLLLLFPDVEWLRMRD